jgi:YD repeat-containing protein
MEVTAVNGTTWTVLRGQEGTTAVAHNNGATVENRWTAGTYSELAGVDDLTWSNISGKPSEFTPTAHASTHASGGADPVTPASIEAVDLTTFNSHKSRHATGGADALAPGDIGAASASDLAAHLADETPHEGYVAQVGTSNQTVNLFKALNQRVDTRSVELVYDANDMLITMTEKDGSTTVKTTSLSYDASGNLTTVTETVGCKTVTITLTYDAGGNLASVTRSVV